MNMKRTINALTAGVLLLTAAFSATGCGSDESSSKKKESTSSAASAEKSDASEADTTEAAADKDSDDGEVSEDIAVVKINGVDCDLNNITLLELATNESWTFSQKRSSIYYEKESSDYDLCAIKCTSKVNSNAPFLCIQGVYNEKIIDKATTDEEKKKYTEDVGKVQMNFATLDDEGYSSFTDVVSFTVSRSECFDKENVFTDFYTFAGGVKLGMTKNEVEGKLGMMKPCSEKNTYSCKNEDTLMFVTYADDEGELVLDEVSIIKKGYEHPVYELYT